MLLKNCETQSRDNGDVKFDLSALLCSCEGVSVNSICLNVLKCIRQFYLLMWFKKTRLEISFKSDNVKALIKTSNCENLVLNFSEKVQNIVAFAMLLWF